MFNDLLFRIRSLFRRDTFESEADTELRFHFDQQIAKLMKSGLTREEAMKAARFLAAVVGQAHARQMDMATKKKWQEELHHHRGLLCR